MPHAKITLATATVLALTAAPAFAGIKCVNGMQVIGDKLHATPFCQDNYLARIARSRGINVSNAEIRNNPNKKRDVCDFIGQDIRISHICDGARTPLPGFGGR